MKFRLGVLLVGLLMAASAAAQTPKPFPQPTKPIQPPPTTQPVPPVVPPAGARPSTTSGSASDVPTEAMLGAPVYPAAQFITSYDAGRGQRYYLFGTSATFDELVLYYRTSLKTRGSELFDSPPTYQFETGRFREETMAFPPSVTIKDFTWGGSAGYPNPRRGGKPERYPTIIQIVPAPPGSPQ